MCRLAAFKSLSGCPNHPAVVLVPSFGGQRSTRSRSTPLSTAESITEISLNRSGHMHTLRKLRVPESAVIRQSCSADHAIPSD